MIRKCLVKSAIILAVMVIVCTHAFATSTVNIHRLPNVNLRIEKAALANDKKIALNKPNASKILKELNACKRIEILNFSDRYRVILINKNDKNASTIINTVSNLIKNRNAVTEDGVAAIVTKYYFRFYVSPDTAYVAKLDVKAKYFEMVEKIRIRKQKGKEVTEKIQLLSIPFGKAPSDFFRKMEVALHNVERDYPRVKPWTF